MENVRSVLQIGNRWFPELPTGLERYYYDLVRHLPAAGFEVLGLVLGKAAPVSGPGLEVRAYATPMDSIPKRLYALRRWTHDCVRTRCFSLLACHYAPYGLPISDIMSALPTIFHFHGPWAAEGQVERNSCLTWLAKRAIEDVLYKRPAGFVVLSRAFGEILHRTYGIPNDRIFKVPGGVDMVRFNSNLDRVSARNQLGLAIDRPIVLTIRRLVRRMGIENLIEAMTEVAPRVPDALLIIGGDGALRAEIELRIQERGLDNRVQLLGKVPDEHLPLLYRAADISIVPSTALEGFGLTTIESLACGTPVLVTPVGGLPEAVGDLSTDLILPGQEPHILAEGIIAFFKGNLHWPDAAACTSYARQYFDWPVVAKGVADAYSAVLARV